MTVDEASPGFFGKLPALGDFVQRRLPAPFVRAWDGWLQGCVAGSKAALGEHWLNTYLSSPIWRFALTPGVAGELGWTGVMIPSVDRVGRYFPLTVATVLPEHSRTLDVAHAQEWFDRAESVALNALEEQGFDLETFSASVAALGPCPVSAAPSVPVPQQGAVAGGFRLSVDDVNHAPAALEGLCDMFIRERFGPSSLWWTSGSELISPNVIVCRGLPEPAGYTAMLDGQWHSTSWCETDVASTSVDVLADA
ncbi:MAG: type VI secretion system-associated protein TagF [Gammaproteobacteria bacterium]